MAPTVSHTPTILPKCISISHSMMSGGALDLDGDLWPFWRLALASLEGVPVGTARRFPSFRVRYVSGDGWTY